MLTIVLDILLIPCWASACIVLCLTDTYTTPTQLNLNLTQLELECLHNGLDHPPTPPMKLCVVVESPEMARKLIRNFFDFKINALFKCFLSSLRLMVHRIFRHQDWSTCLMAYIVYNYNYIYCVIFLHITFYVE